MSASALTVSVISSVSFGTYKNFLCTICKLRYGAADAKPSKLDVSLAGGAAGAVRVGKQPKGKAKQEILFTNLGGWKSSECFLSGRPQGSLQRARWVCFSQGVTLCPRWPLAGWPRAVAESCWAAHAGFGLECQNT